MRDETHMLTHIPETEESEYYVRGKGVALGHLRVPGDFGPEKRTIELDYSFSKDCGGFINDANKPVATTLSVRDNAASFGMAISSKTQTHRLKYISDSVASIDDSLGHLQVTVQGDGERTIKLVTKEIRTTCEATEENHDFLEIIPRYSSQSHKDIQRFQTVVQGDKTILRYFLKGEYQ